MFISTNIDGTIEKPRVSIQVFVWQATNCIITNVNSGRSTLQSVIIISRIHKLWITRDIVVIQLHQRENFHQTANVLQHESPQHTNHWYYLQK